MTSARTLVSGFLGTGFDPVDGGDVRVVQRGEETGLALEPRQPLRVRREDDRQDLDRDIASESGIAAAIDLTHAADAQPRDDLIRAEALPDRQPAQAGERRVRVQCRLREELLGGRGVRQQRLDLVPQRLVALTGFDDERRTFARRVLQGGETNPLDVGQLVQMALISPNSHRVANCQGLIIGRTGQDTEFTRIISLAASFAVSVRRTSG